jgi:hypothetical protein
MREKLLKGIEKLCWMFPQLKPSVRYSEILSQDEVAVFAAFVNGHVQKILDKNQAGEDELSVLFASSCGISRIRNKDVVFVGSLLSAASGRDMGIGRSALVDFLRAHRQVWWSLHNAYSKIVKNELVNTCPIAVLPRPFVSRILPFGSKAHDFNEFHKLFHESLHFVLEDAGICFNDEELDEGLVTYMHQQVMGKSACSRHYTGDEGRKYLEYASVFEKAFGTYPRSGVIPVLLRLKGSTIQ